jgi:hypothetical protein
LVIFDEAIDMLKRQDVSGIAPGKLPDPWSAPTGKVTSQGRKAKGLFRERLANKLGVNKFDDIDWADFTTKEDYRKVIDEVADSVRKEFDEEILGLQSDITRQIQENIYNVPGIRIGSKKLPMRRVGKLYAQAQGKGLGTPKSVSFNKQFPGKLAIEAQKVRSMGYRNVNARWEMHREAAKKFGLSPAERKQVQELIEKNVPPSSPNVQAAADYIMEHYMRLGDTEVARGIRPPSFWEKQAPDNYAYIHFRKGNKKKIDDFRKLRKQEARTGHFNDGTTEAAKAAGLKPTEDAFVNLMYREAKHNRDMTRSWFKTKLLDDLGIQADNLTPEQARKYGWTKVTNKNLPEHYTNQGDWYLPKEVHEVLDHFDNISSGRMPSELRGLQETLTWLNNKFRFAATIPWPGYHMRNMVGDIYMGMIDGVPPSEYKLLWKKIGAYRAGKAGSRRTMPRLRLSDDIEISMDEFDDLFKSYDSSGTFFSNDVNIPGFRQRNVGDKIQQGFDATTNRLRTISETREDFGRQVHFLHALKEELRKNPKGSLNDAIDAATYRLNKYKFDYGALTAGERSIKQVIPFYTYMRKATPALLEAMFLQPQWLSRLNRWQQYNEGSPDFQLGVPDFVHELGYAQLTNEDEPLVMTGDLFPTNALQWMNTLPTSPGTSVREIAGMTNPLIQAPFEIASNEQIFSGREIFEDGTENATPQELMTYLFNKMQPIPSTLSRDFDPGDIVSWIGDRRTLGLSVKRISEGTQNWNLNEKFRTLQERFEQELNPKLDKLGMRAYVSNRKDGISVRIKENDEIVFDGSTEGAMDFLRGKLDL